ncbi:hypothetical protein [Mycobacterium sp. M23085]|uniref:hypothetical protein n=1 Tax=Mycobacterium sp. M23085 TaxID=3378087 RepID=UPI003878139D
MTTLTPTNLPMGIAGEWKPKFRVTAPLVIAKDQAGRLHHCYQGSLLGWLSDQQAQHFLSHGLVERIEDSADVVELPASVTIAECVAALNDLGVELKAGAPTARAALRDAGRRFSNEAVAAAVRLRKAALTRRADDGEAFEEVIAR